MSEVTIERLGHHGDGIAPGPVFVPGALPGEMVAGAVEEGRMPAPRILKPSPDRVKPPCPHARTCGGCVLQHAADGFVERWKAGVVMAALEAQGIETRVDEVMTSPPGSRRRATLSARRTKKGALVGFHARASDTIVEIPDCRLLSPALMAAMPALRELTLKGASRKGELSITVTESESGADVVVEGGKPADGPLRAELARCAAAHGLARLTWGEELIAQRAAPVVRFGDALVTPPAGAFLQATREGENALLSAVTETVFGATRVVDLFAGCGTFALPLARNAEIHAVEGDGAMLEALDAGWRHAQGLHGVTTERRDLFRRPLMADELDRFDAAVIDPPRAGAEVQATELARSGIGTVAMVSCNPVSFARDMRILADAGFAIRSLRVVDQFRWSHHVEIAAGLVRGDGQS